MSKNYEGEEGKSREKEVLIIGASLITVLLGVLIFFLTQGTGISIAPTKDNTAETPAEENSEPFGTLILTTNTPELNKVSENNRGIFAFSLKENTLQNLFTDNDYYRLYGSLDKDHKKIVYARALTFEQQKEKYNIDSFDDSDRAEIFMHNIGTTEPASPLFINHDIDNDNWFRFRPSLSDDGTKIIFSSRKQNGSNNNPDDWSTVVYDYAKDEGVVIQGAMYPVWGKDNTFFLLKSTGLWKYSLLEDLSESQDQISIDTGRIVFGRSMQYVPLGIRIEFSDDKQLLALVDTRYTDLPLVIYKVTDWDNFTTEEMVRLPSDPVAMFPVFSPDNKYVATYQIVENEQDLSVEGFKLVIYNLETLASSEYDVPGATWDKTFVDDWTYEDL